MASTLLPTYARFPVRFVRGKGSFVSDGKKRYLDFVSGLAVTNLGHSHPKLIRALNQQSQMLWHTSNLYEIPNQERLADKLVELSGLHQAFFCNSGTEAMEACIKFTRACQSPRFEIIVMKNSFHGRTYGSLSATAQPKYKKGFGPMLPGFKVVPFNDLERVRRSISGKTAALLVEPIQGEGGVHIPDVNYLKGLRALCDDCGLLLMLDEVQVGMGRTGKFFAHQHEGIKPDLMALSKALGNGLPIGAALVSSTVAAVIHPGMHASTFGGNPLCTRVALEVVNLISKKSFLNRVTQTGRYFLERLEGLHPLLKNVRGRGLMLASDLAKPIGAEIVKASLGRGLLMNTIHGRILRFVPPLTITKKEIDLGLGILKSVLNNL